MFFEAITQVSVPAVVSAPASALPRGVPTPPGLRVVELAPAAYLGALKAASVVVVPLQQRHDRAAGQSTYLTAMALGKLVVVVDSLAVREHVEDRVTGLVVAPEPAALAAALRWALDPANAAEVDAIRDAARRIATTRFSPRPTSIGCSRSPAGCPRLPAGASDGAENLRPSRPVRRRVAMVEFPPSGGLFQFSVQLGEALARRGHRVDIVTGPRPELRSREADCRIHAVLPDLAPPCGIWPHRRCCGGPVARSARPAARGRVGPAARPARGPPTRRRDVVGVAVPGRRLGRPGRAPTAARRRARHRGPRAAPARRAAR